MGHSNTRAGPPGIAYLWLIPVFVCAVLALLLIGRITFYRPTHETALIVEANTMSAFWDDAALAKMPLPIMGPCKTEFDQQLATGTRSAFFAGMEPPKNDHRQRCDPIFVRYAELDGAPFIVVDYNPFLVREVYLSGLGDGGRWRVAHEHPTDSGKQKSSRDANKCPPTASDSAWWCGSSPYSFPSLPPALVTFPVSSSPPSGIGRLLRALLGGAPALGKSGTYCGSVKNWRQQRQDSLKEWRRRYPGSTTILVGDPDTLMNRLKQRPDVFTRIDSEKTALGPAALELNSALPTDLSGIDAYALRDTESGFDVEVWCALASGPAIETFDSRRLTIWNQSLFHPSYPTNRGPEAFSCGGSNHPLPKPVDTGFLQRRWYYDNASMMSQVDIIIEAPGIGGVEDLQFAAVPTAGSEEHRTQLLRPCERVTMTWRDGASSQTRDLILILIGTLIAIGAAACIEVIRPVLDYRSGPPGRRGKRDDAPSAQDRGPVVE